MFLLIYNFILLVYTSNLNCVFNNNQFIFHKNVKNLKNTNNIRKLFSLLTYDYIFLSNYVNIKIVNFYSSIYLIKNNLEKQNQFVTNSIEMCTEDAMYILNIFLFIKKSFVKKDFIKINELIEFLKNLNIFEKEIVNLSLIVNSKSDAILIEMLKHKIALVQIVNVYNNYIICYKKCYEIFRKIKKLKKY